MIDPLKLKEASVLCSGSDKCVDGGSRLTIERGAQLAGHASVTLEEARPVKVNAVHVTDWM